MAYLTREDGEKFIIPYYRDILSAKKGSLLKKEILLLSENYGGYVVIQKKNMRQYEVAFSPEPGYLLGESIWHYFKRPIDMVYCEVIPNTAEAILVIVKSSSVYLDGRFPIDSIPEELAVFLTQKNQFEIYVYGDVPISVTPEEGKFSFDSTHVKSFNELSEPIFEKLPLIKTFQFQLVEVALNAQGIGIFPAKQIIFLLVLIGLGWMGWNYLTSQKRELPQTIVRAVNPYQAYLNLMTSPNPATEIALLSKQVVLLSTLSGWMPTTVTYSNGKMVVAVKSLGVDTGPLLFFAKHNRFNVEVKSEGFYLSQTFTLKNRLPPKTITKLDSVIAGLVDTLSYILPGDVLSVGDLANRGGYRESKVDIRFKDITPMTLSLIGQEISNMPFVLSSVNINFANGALTGKISLVALGS